MGRASNRRREKREHGDQGDSGFKMTLAAAILESPETQAFKAGKSENGEQRLVIVKPSQVGQDNAGNAQLGIPPMIIGQDDVKLSADGRATIDRRVLEEAASKANYTPYWDVIESCCKPDEQEWMTNRYAHVAELTEIDRIVSEWGYAMGWEAGPLEWAIAKYEMSQERGMQS